MAVSALEYRFPYCRNDGFLRQEYSAILRRVRPAAVVVIETGLYMHQPFKGPVLAGSKVHSVASFLNLGMEKAADFF